GSCCHPGREHTRRNSWVRSWGESLVRLSSDTRFQKALNEQLMALRDLRWCPRYRIGGIDLTQTSQRLARLGIPSQMRQSGRQTTESYPIRGSLPQTPLGNPHS